MAILTWRCLLAALGRVGMHLMLAATDQTVTWWWPPPDAPPIMSEALMMVGNVRGWRSVSRLGEVGLCQTFDPNGRLHQHWTGSNEGTYDNEKDYRRCSYRALPCRVRWR